jgi:hypothetical protein
MLFLARYLQAQLRESDGFCGTAEAQQLFQLRRARFNNSFDIQCGGESPNQTSLSRCRDNPLSSRMNSAATLITTAAGTLVAGGMFYSGEGDIIIVGQLAGRSGKSEPDLLETEGLCLLALGVSAPPSPLATAVAMVESYGFWPTALT